MTSKAEPFRRCQAANCFRHAREDSNLCDAHWRNVIEDALGYHEPGTGDWTEAKDDRDGGNNEK